MDTVITEMGIIRLNHAHSLVNGAFSVRKWEGKKPRERSCYALKNV